MELELKTVELVINWLMEIDANAQISYSILV